ncbi:response regulator [Hymenobacter ginsengisoli]|uniref:Response regulator n=1 Tax=Hymenobacter ginsengisoli TaxID=1051626 RepID=A0ABP8QLT8_9BACT|nr:MULTISPECIES: response regulator [unclassified Hymenobacter]MBO2033053.1 response regulator [Hymenobacter sp. BT559]
MTPLPCVLLVDDDATTNFLNRSLLTRLGVAERIVVAEDGEQALAELRQHCSPPTPGCPALILLDVNMPGMNGIEFLEEYQHLELAAQPAIVIVMLTSSLHPRDVQRVAQLGIVADFISKPLTAEKVGTLLQAYFPPAPAP